MANSVAERVKREQEEAIASNKYSENDYVDMHMYDEAVDSSAAYQKRLANAMAIVEPHLPASSYGDDMRYNALNYSGLAGGETNFWSDPYAYMRKDTKIQNDPEYFKSPRGRDAGAFVSQMNPYRIGINPYMTGDQNLSWTNMLAHEGGHQPYWINQNRRLVEVGGGKVYNPSTNWEPAFSSGFYNDYIKEGRKTDSPLYGFYPEAGGRFPNMEAEGMSYLLGLEGSLRKGQTLQDHPTTKELFRKHPGMYEEYMKAKARLYSIK